MTDFWDDSFHAIAFAAFIQVARERQAWPAEQETKERAYTLYDQRDKT